MRPPCRGRYAAAIILLAARATSAQRVGNDDAGIQYRGLWVHTTFNDDDGRPEALVGTNVSGSTATYSFRGELDMKGSSGGIEGPKQPLQEQGYRCSARSRWRARSISVPLTASTAARRRSSCQPTRSQRPHSTRGSSRSTRSPTTSIPSSSPTRGRITGSTISQSQPRSRRRLLRQPRDPVRRQGRRPQQPPNPQRRQERGHHLRARRNLLHLPPTR